MTIESDGAIYDEGLNRMMTGHRRNRYARKSFILFIEKLCHSVTKPKFYISLKAGVNFTFFNVCNILRILLRRCSCVL